MTLADRMHDPHGVIQFTDAQDAWTLLRAEWPLPDAVFASNPGTFPNSAVYPDRLAHISFNGDSIGTMDFYHEAGHVLEWEALIRRYPADRVWAPTNAIWADPANSVLLDYYAARGLTLPLVFDGAWATQPAEQFAETFMAVNLGTFERASVPPTLAADSMRAFFTGLFPAAAPTSTNQNQPAPQGGSVTASEVLDYFSPHDRATMAAFNTQGIGRYLTNSSSDVRQLTPQEVADAHALGLSVHCFYEMNPTYPAYFTFAQGAEDCRQAQARLAELGAPDGTVVHFAVDTNIDPALTVDYFNGIDSAVTPKITPGVYGYQRMCEFAYANFPNIGKHLWQTYGTPTVPLDGFQHLQENRAGVAVDVNTVNVPGWKGQDMTPDQVRAIIAEYLASTYGPALEAELAQRQSDTVAAAVKAVGTKLTA